MPSHPFAGLRVLVVDDDPLCLKVVAHMLQRCNYDGRCWEALGLHSGRRSRLIRAADLAPVSVSKHQQRSGRCIMPSIACSSEGVLIPVAAYLTLIPQLVDCSSACRSIVTLAAALGYFALLPADCTPSGLHA